jgi:hypothetical protein
VDSNCPQVNKGFSNASSNYQNTVDYPSFDDIIDNNNNNFINNNLNNINTTKNFNQQQPYQPNLNIINSNSNFNYNNIPNNKNQQQSQQIWQYWLNYNKTPIFLKSRTPQVYMGNLDKKEFKIFNNINFNFPLYSSKCELPDGSIFVTGGDNIGDTLNTCFIYSQFNGIVAKRNMITSRKLHSTIFMDGFVYVFGGFDGNDIRNNCEKYDLKNDTWFTISLMAMNRAYTSLLRYGNDYIFVIGGANGMGDDVILIIVIINL